MDKQRTLSRKHFLFFLVILLPFVFTSCYEEDNSYGSQWVDSAFRNISIDTSTVFTTAVSIDSLVLSLTCAGQFVGDTTVPLALHIHRLAEKIALNANGHLYNHSTFAYASDLLATYTFKPKPHLGERMEIRLTDASLQFNHIDHDRWGTSLEAYPEKQSFVELFAQGIERTVHRMLPAVTFSLAV